jgi:hypothetical protein
VKIIPNSSPTANTTAHAQFRLLLCDQGHDADREPVGMRHVHGDEVHVAVAQVEQKGGVADSEFETAKESSSICYRATPASPGIERPARLQ